MGDDYLSRAIHSMVAMWSHVATSCGGRVQRWPDAVAADAGAPNAVLNRTTIVERGTDAASLVERARSFYAGSSSPWGIVDPWAELDLADAGFERIGSMPCMVLEDTMRRPEPPVAIQIEQVGGPRGARDFERALFGGFSFMTWPDGPLFGDTFGEGACRAWVAYEDHEPVACAAALIGDGSVGVYLVATVPERRGRGYGEAVSWAAATAEPGSPALLQASPMGQPVYERMGFREIGRCAFWLRQSTDA